MLIVFLGVLFLLRGHPIRGVRCLISITLVFSFYLYFRIGLFWFSGILLLVMLRGVLVLFTYIASLSPNEIFEMVGVGVGLVVVCILSMRFGTEQVVIRDSRLMVVKLWEGLMGLVNLYIVVLLLFTILVVVWITRVFLGAVRV